MKVTAMSIMTSIFWSSLFIVVVYLFRKNQKVSLLSEIVSIIVLYVLSLGRIFIPIDFESTIGVSISKKISRVYDHIFTKTQNYRDISFKIIYIILAIWFIVFFLKLFFFVVEYIQLKKCIDHFDIWNDQNDIMNKIYKESKRIVPVTIRHSSKVKIPMGIGVFNRVIVLPEQSYSEEKLYYILYHEYTHFINYDLIVKLLTKVYVLFFWWNPIVYLLQKDIDQTLEMKCDLSVIRNYPVEKVVEYLQTIVEVMKEIKESNHQFYGITAMAVKKNDCMIERFEAVSKNQKEKKESWKGYACIGVYFLFFIFSYMFVPRPSFDPPLSDIETDENAISLEPDNSYIILKEDGEYHWIREGVTDGIIPESLANDLEKHGFEVIR